MIDNTLFRADVPVLIQGITGRAGRSHALLMKQYGTRVVAGVSAKGGAPIEDIPVFTAIAEAVARTGARASLLMVPPLAVLGAVEEALDAGIELLVCVAEGVPVHDALKITRLAAQRGAVCIGPSTPGLAIPGRMKIGFLPDAALSPGPLGVMSRSGTLSYELCYRLGQTGIGQSLWVGVGGDPVKGARFADLVPLFQDHAETQALLLIGEIGGSEEESFAAALTAARFDKPVFALLAGTSAPEGVMMGHAGALVHGARGTAASKLTALTQAGVHVYATMRELVQDVPRRLAERGIRG